MADDSEGDDAELAQALYLEWNNGDGTSKSEIERRVWGDGSSHGRRFDRFIRQNLGVPTTRRSRQTDRIADLERQVRSLGSSPAGSTPSTCEAQVLHARDSCLAALRIWNDPTARFRTGAFALLFVTAWNSLAIAILERDGGEWRKIKNGKVETVNGTEQSKDTAELIALALPGDERRGLRENVQFWLDLRNCVAHRHLPALDISVIPYAQAGLLNMEGVLDDEFGVEFSLAECLSVPLQLSGFRDPGVLASRKKLQAALPPDVQAILSRAEDTTPELLADQTFVLRVAFIPAVPASGKSPDAVAYFVKPGEVPAELAEVLEQYVVLPKVAMGARPNLAASQVMSEVERRTGFKFHSGLHADAARHLGARPPKGEDDKTVELRYAEYITSFKRYLYSQAWIDLLVERLATPEGFLEVTGKEPVVIEPEE